MKNIIGFLIGGFIFLSTTSSFAETVCVIRQKLPTGVVKDVEVSWKECKEQSAFRETLDKNRESRAKNPQQQATPTLYLRQNLDDLKSFAGPSDPNQSKGLQVSATKDKTTDTTSQTIQGLVGVGFTRQINSRLPDNNSTFLERDAFGIYVSADQAKNPAAPKGDKDILTSGARYENVYANAVGGADLYTGFTTDIVTGFNGKTRNFRVGLDYTLYGEEERKEGVPFSIFHIMNRPTALNEFLGNASEYRGPLNEWMLNFSPRLRAEYRGNMAEVPDPLFKEHDRVVRVGPLLSLSLFGNYLIPKESSSLFRGVAQEEISLFASRSVFKVSYASWFDLLSSRDQSYVEASYTWNLDRKGNSGITFSYRHGNQEETGAKVDLYKIALGIKLDQPLIKAD